jgi:hypothetical protein
MASGWSREDTRLSLCCDCCPLTFSCNLVWDSAFCPTGSMKLLEGPRGGISRNTPRIRHPGWGHSRGILRTHCTSANVLVLCVSVVWPSPHLQGSRRADTACRVYDFATRSALSLLVPVNVPPILIWCVSLVDFPSVVGCRF